MPDISDISRSADGPPINTATLAPRGEFAPWGRPGGGPTSVRGRKAVTPSPAARARPSGVDADSRRLGRASPARRLPTARRSPTIRTSGSRFTPVFARTVSRTNAISASMSAAFALPAGLTMKLACFSDTRAFRRWHGPSGRTPRSAAPRDRSADCGTRCRRWAGRQRLRRDAPREQFLDARARRGRVAHRKAEPRRRKNARFRCCAIQPPHAAIADRVIGWPPTLDRRPSRVAALRHARRSARFRRHSIRHSSPARRRRCRACRPGIPLPHIRNAAKRASFGLAAPASA